MFTFSDKSRGLAVPWLLTRFPPHFLRKFFNLMHIQVFDLVWRDYRLHLVDFSTDLLDNHALADIKLICDGGEVSKQMSEQTNNDDLFVKSKIENKQ